ncbi:uncharacterized protein [Montipora foliosa]|uniref:uncharacterized protein isoform X2 n=1 Tax=Montipora foliosa TaxID=591990 RepID=UPI0035F187F5
MGNRQTSHQEIEQRSPRYESLSKLFEELAEANDGESSLKKGTFQTFFGSKVDDFDELLFSHIAIAGGINRNTDQLTRDVFIDGFENFLDKGKTADGKLELYFTVFSDGESTMSFTDLVEMFQISKSLALIVNTSDSEDANAEMQTIADVWARSIGFHHIPWIDEHATLSYTSLNTETLWILSTILPTCFLGSVPHTYHSPEQQSKDIDDAKPVERHREWELLYDSEQHGQSLNRFKHHSLAYRGPTVTLLRVGKEELLVVAVDVEWRESSSSWGNSDCRIIQIRPKFQVLRAGPNLIFFNERARGLPSGIVLGQTSRPCVTLDTSMTSAKLHYQANLSPQIVEKIEVWGCGGRGMKEKQRTQQQWERKQAEKLQKVQRPGRWDENPDKAILEMAGVTTNHSQR